MDNKKKHHGFSKLLLFLLFTVGFVIYSNTCKASSIPQYNTSLEDTFISYDAYDTMLSYVGILTGKSSKSITVVVLLKGEVKVKVRTLEERASVKFCVKVSQKLEYLSVIKSKPREDVISPEVTTISSGSNSVIRAS